MLSKSAKILAGILTGVMLDRVTSEELITFLCWVFQSVNIVYFFYLFTTSFISFVFLWFSTERYMFCSNSTCKFLLGDTVNGSRCWLLCPHSLWCYIETLFVYVDFVCWNLSEPLFKNIFYLLDCLLPFGLFEIMYEIMRQHVLGKWRQFYFFF